MELKRLDNIDVSVTAIEPMYRFYREVLGLPLRLPYDPAEGWAGFVAGDVVIYLIEETSSHPHPAPRTTGGDNPPGIDSFAFEVDDLDEAIEVLSERGVSWAGDIVASAWYRYRGFHDPEGNLIYVTEPLLDRQVPPVPRPES